MYISSMEQVFVYKIVNLLDEVEHVGETVNLHKRWTEHKRKPWKTKLGNYKNGKFHGRDDVRMEVISEHDSKEIAYQEQLRWQEFYGLPTDKEIYSNNGKKTITKNATFEGRSKGGKITGKIRTSTVVICPGCNKPFQGPRGIWHARTMPCQKQSH